MMLDDDESCDHAVIDGMDNLLRKAALYSYQDLLHLLSTAEDDGSQRFIIYLYVY